eukprot:238092_1
MESTSVVLTVESVLDQLLRQNWIHPSAKCTEKCQGLLSCLHQLKISLQTLSYDSKYQLLNGNTLHTNPLYQILSKLKHEQDPSIQDIYSSLIDILITNGADISLTLPITHGNNAHHIAFAIYYHIHHTMQSLHKTNTEIVDLILHVTNLWYKCRLSLYDFKLSEHPSVVTFTSDAHMFYLSGVFQSIPQSDIIYKLFCNGFQVFNMTQNTHSVINKRKWSDLGLVFMVYLNYKQTMSNALKHHLQHTVQMRPCANICDIIDEYQFGTTSVLYSQIVSDHQWIVFALKYIYSHSIKWKMFLKDNILLNQNILKPNEFKVVQNAIARWGTHTFFYTQWLKEETHKDIATFYIAFYNGIWDTWHMIALLNKYRNDHQMLEWILNNCRYHVHKVWFEKPLLLITNTKQQKKKRTCTSKMSGKSTLLFDLLMTQDKALECIIQHLIQMKEGRYEYVSYESAYSVHKMFIDLYGMFCKQFRESDETHVIWNNMKYLLNALRKSGNSFMDDMKHSHSTAWNKKLDIEYGLVDAFRSCNLGVVRFLVSAEVVNMNRCLQMGYLNAMFNLLLNKKNRRGNHYKYGGDTWSGRDMLRVNMISLIVDRLIICEKKDALESYLLDWMNKSKNCNNEHCVNIFSSAVSAIAVA